ncbi:hypothetical protein BX589_102364 [Paraburkholderia fungorum]|uniref:hypothetical protein n=1 Tax=Paraburkholderia fungorum TaxID=134537 RepID=UPI000D078916|nr:hypothetical protein [Paraburkholderia fungorum]PRZ56163.1 hypothetical protein BX589_102364 [Paraburkholderia fungorum]
MSDNPIKAQIQGQSSGNDTVWSVTLTHADGRTASANGFASSADAQRAEEFLRLGFATGWQIQPRLEKLSVAHAGADAYRDVLDNPEPGYEIMGDEWVAAAVWEAMINEWTRLMMARIERGEEPDESE